MDNTILLFKGFTICTYLLFTSENICFSFDCRCNILYLLENITISLSNNGRFKMTEVILKFSPNFSVNVLGKKYLKGVKNNNNNKIYSYTGSKSKFLEFLFFDFFS